MTSVTRSDGIVDINYYVDAKNACNVYPEGNVGNRDSGGIGNLNESYGRIYFRQTRLCITIIRLSM